MLCHTYKLFERLKLNQVAEHVDAKLIPEQAGFRPRKTYTNQLLNLTEHIEDGYEKRLITAVLSSWTCLLPTTRPTTDASSARCYRWLVTYTWPSWYAPCWKANASSWCWTGRRAVGDDNETDYRMEVCWHRSCSTSTPTTSPYTPILASSSTQTTYASRRKETTSTASKRHSRLPWALWLPATTRTNCVRTLPRHRCVLST